MRAAAPACREQETNFDSAMAIVLDAYTSYIQNMLTEMAKVEVHMLIGFPREIIKMKTKLRDTKKLLVDADRRNVTDQSVQAWVKKFRGAMYDVTDILDLCQLKAMERGPSLDMGFFNPLFFYMRNPLHAHDIGTRLKSLNGKLDDIIKHGTTFNFMDVTSYQDRGRRIESSHLASRETTGEFDKLGVVGENIEEDTRNLIELLTRKNVTTHEHNKIKVFAIVGAGGIGKTTLAQNIFNSKTIQQEFNKKIWLSVNQDFNDLDLLERAITEAGGELQVARNTKFALVRNLKQALGGFKTLLVMDDVWDYQAWERVLKSPLTNTLGQGSCVLVTTRNDTVARGMMAEEPYHHVNKLESEDAWSLLKKQVVRTENDETQVDMLKDIGMEIIAKCDGLPLAIKVMGGLLCQKRTRRCEWKNVVNNSQWSISQMPEELNYAIYLSYQDLHPFLKPCFLHFSLLPTKIGLFSADDIVGMWIGEGFIHGDSRDFEELGKEFFNELILRNLIEPDTRFVDHDFCDMHDVIRWFAQYMARDEALVSHSSKTDINDKLNSQNFVRLSLETKDSESSELEWVSLQTHDSLRTLISVGPIKIKSGDSLVTFSSLRVLHIHEANVGALVESLAQLKHLRYLSIIEDDNLSILPENIGKLKFLQYISLFGCITLEKLPSSIGELQHLRVLNIRHTCINNVPMGFHDLTDLRKLYGFPAHMDGDRCSLEELGCLSKLTDLHIDRLENISSSSFAGKAKLFEKVHLRYLELYCSSTHGDPLIEDDENMSNQRQQQIKEVFDELCPPSCIEHLSINGYFGRQLPSWMTSTTAPPFGSLRVVMMEDLPFCTELPDGLCQLPCLELLKIVNAPGIKRVGPELSQRHHHNKHPRASLNFGSAVEVMVAQCSGLERICNLPKTQELIILWCPKLKVVEGMPSLQRLDLVDEHMKTLPGYLQDLRLKHLHVDIGITLLTSMAAGKSGTEWVKFSHIKQVKAYADDDDNKISRKWFVLYTRDPFSFRTNISRSSIAKAREERIQGMWSAYSSTCPIEEEKWASSDKRRPLCERFRCNAYRYLVSWLCDACLHCSEADDVADSSDQWIDATGYSACTEITV